MQAHYHPEEVEARARAWWQERRTFRVTEDPDREKFYCLCMFPYPSGRLHMGHVRNYTIGDVVGRYQRMLGKNVLQPMGWDAFGLPAENAAIDAGVAPAKWTRENIATMKGQLQRLGFGYDWERELTTCRPEYYRWEQWFFNRLYEKGVAYKHLAEVNWDPVEGTVLANEQVVNGRGWRSGAPVERRRIPHWFLKITDYADELLDSLEALDWPDAVKNMQRHWIGRSEGVEFDFALESGEDALRVFTTRPDTLFGATFMAVAPEHPVAKRRAEQDPDIARFVEECRVGSTAEADLETMEKVGRPLGVHAVNPVNRERIPVWVANFVLMGYGTGAIMAVPGHDERDHEFARRYGLPIRQVIAPADDTEVDIRAEAWTSKENMVTVDSGDFSGLDYARAFDTFSKWLERHANGERKVNYRLRDWGVSRQRYWGCPVPILHTESGRERPVPDADLPVRLPEDVALSGGGSPLATISSFVDAVDPETGEPARRDTDTFDTFIDSAWYYARFACPDAQSMVDERANYWLPVDQYIGGIEHAVLHLLYARFYYKLMRDEGLLDSDEPFTNLLCQGMVLKETYYRENPDGPPTWYSPYEVDIEHDEKGKVIGARLKADGAPVEVGGVEKMSKQKKNGVDPEDMVRRYGADTVRLYMMFTSPPEQTLEWQDGAVVGMYSFLKRLWKRVHTHAAGGSCEPLDPGTLDGRRRDLRRRVHETIAKVSDDVGRRYKFNTAIAAIIELDNELARLPVGDARDRALMQEALESIVLLLSPVVPHVCHELWFALGHERAVVDEPWPRPSEDALAREEMELVVQVNGKLRGHISVPVHANDRDITDEAFNNENVRRFVAGRDVRRTVVVPGRLVNIVV